MAVHQHVPTVVKIGAVDYEIHSMTPEEGRKEDCMGKCDEETGVISVVFEGRGRTGAVTLLHEILHALWGEYDLGHAEKEERAVTALSNGVAAAMRDNPAVFEWIKGTLA